MFRIKPGAVKGVLDSRCASIHPIGLVSRAELLTTTDEMNNLDLISVFQGCLLPMAAGHHRLVEFDRDSLRRQGQPIK